MSQTEKETLVFVDAMPVDYVVVSADSMLSLGMNIREYTKNGWKMQGGVSVVPNPNPNPRSPLMFYQAMWRERRYVDYAANTLDTEVFDIQVVRERNT